MDRHAASRQAAEALKAGSWLNRGWAPVFVAAPTVLLYWIGTPDSDLRVILAGFLLGSVAWLVFGYASGLAATASAANTLVYDEQRSRQGAIARSVEILKPADPDPAHADPPRAFAWQQAKGSSERISTMLQPTGPSIGWASGESYVGTWSEIHRAEEALLPLMDVGSVIARADINKQRLSGSRMADRKGLTAQLDGAIRDLQKVDCDADCRARAVASIQAIDRAINEYRDDRSAGLVRLGIDLARWQLMLGLVVYTLFAAAILSVEPTSQLVQSFAAFYLIGAAAGLMFEVWKRRQDRPAVEDYGLSRARLRVVPLLSGSAACAGVFLVGLLGDNTLAELLAIAEPPSYAKLSLEANPALAVVAAVFGLAPGRLLRSLEALGEKLEGDLSASEPTGSDDGGDQPDGT